MTADELAERALETLSVRPEGIYLNTAAEGLVLKSHDAAVASYFEAKSRGSRGRSALAETEQRTRVLFANLISASASEIAFVASTSRGLDAAIKSILWKAGDNIVLADSEFPSALFAAALLEREGVETKLVAYRDGAVHESDIVRSITDRTRLVVISLVSFKTGQRMDVATISEAAHGKGALVFVDAVQALGCIPVSPQGADFLCAGTFKWLLGSHGLAALYVAPRAADWCRAPYAAYRSVTQLFPPHYRVFSLHADARRYEEGMPNLLGISVLESALLNLETVGIVNIERHNRALADRLRGGIRSLGLRLLCPDDTTPRASIVAFEFAQHDVIARELEAIGTTVWAGDGRVRLSPHLYNTRADIDTALEQLAGLTKGNIE
jgi:selenocysteine lyase/cysteine desulfurase